MPKSTSFLSIPSFLFASLILVENAAANDAVVNATIKVGNIFLISNNGAIFFLKEIHKTIATKTSEIDDIQDEIEEMEDKISALEYEISDLQTLTDEALIHITKIWCENLKQEFPQFGATILEDNTIIRLQIPVKGENIYALLELNDRKYKLTSSDGSHNRDMYFLLKDIIPEPTPQQSTYGYGYVDFEKAYEVFSELIRKLEKL